MVKKTVFVHDFWFDDVDQQQQLSCCLVMRRHYYQLFIKQLGSRMMLLISQLLV